MYKPNVQTTKRTKGSFAWQDTSFVRKTKRLQKAKAIKAKVLKHTKVEKPLRKIKDEFGVTITIPSNDWMNAKLQQNRIMKAI